MHGLLKDYFGSAVFITLQLLYVLGQWLRFWIEPRQASMAIAEWHLDYVYELQQAARDLQAEITGQLEDMDND